LTVIAGATVSADAIEAFDHKLEGDLGMYDFAYRISNRRWVVAWDNDVEQARKRIETLGLGNLDSASPIRLHWSPIGTLPIRDNHTTRLLADRMARETLTDSESSYAAMDHPVDAHELRPSAVPGDRLVAELRHLAARVRAQNNHLINQACQLRPSTLQHSP
jgi:hypothetical protein